MSSFQINANGYVYETFGISKHFPVKLQVPLIRAEMLDNPLTAKCFIYDVTCWRSVYRHFLFFLIISSHCFKSSIFFSGDKSSKSGTLEPITLTGPLLVIM